MFVYPWLTESTYLIGGNCCPTPLFLVDCSQRLFDQCQRCILIGQDQLYFTLLGLTKQTPLTKDESHSFLTAAKTKAWLTEANPCLTKYKPFRLGWPRPTLVWLKVWHFDLSQLMQYMQKYLLYFFGILAFLKLLTSPRLLITCPPLKSVLICRKKLRILNEKFIINPLGMPNWIILKLDKLVSKDLSLSHSFICMGNNLF